MSDTDFNNAGVKAVITLGTFAVIGVMAVVISKAVQVCLKKNYTSDNDSEISENTRELIRSRLSVIQFRKRERQKSQRVRTVNIFHKWGDMVKNRKQNKAQNPQGNDQVVINIQKLDGVKENGAIECENSTIREIGSPKLERCPSITQAKPHLEVSRATPPNNATSPRPATSNRTTSLTSTSYRPTTTLTSTSHRPTTPSITTTTLTPTSHRPTTPNRTTALTSTSHRLTTPSNTTTPTSHRPTTINRTTALTSTAPNKVSPPPKTMTPNNVTLRETTNSPVPRGHPVISKQHTPSNVTLTDVDINNAVKVHIKSVHFEDVVSDVKINVDIENKSGEKT